MMERSTFRRYVTALKAFTYTTHIYIYIYKRYIIYIRELNVICIFMCGGNCVNCVDTQPFLYVCADAQIDIPMLT